MKTESEGLNYLAKWEGYIIFQTSRFLFAHSSYVALYPFSQFS